MILNFLAPSTRHPVGGNAVVYEFATEMARRGHTVHFFHHELFGGDAVASLNEIGWYTFREPLIHHFMTSGPATPEEIPTADIFFGYSTMVEEHPRIGLPVCWIQGYRMYPDDRELENFRKPCPKICIAEWLVDVAIDHQVPAEQLIHISNAIDHRRFPLSRPIDGRPAQVSFCYNAHPMKGAALALEVLEDLHDRRPDVPIVGFGTKVPKKPLPEWIEFHESPDQHVLAQEIYNRSSIFLWTSEVEGFGLPAVEAMACGAALVTTNNGGSRDFAFADQTALTADYPERSGLLNQVTRLLDDESLRSRIAHAGRNHAATLSWERCGDQLEDFLGRYRAAPTEFGRP
ncbi:MAG: glycosyltransferase involved in cell wall biosynthesis [Candidatus Aldehydirespiratoraceae bacterium]|jgi:glycosyltransferase involved in cell wall biosynthesis